MNRRLFSAPLLCAAWLITGLLLTGCEPQFDAPEELTLQARSAIDVLPAGAQAVGMIDVAAMRQQPALNPFGNKLLAFDGAHDEATARIQNLLEATGFDPQTDLQSLYFALVEGTDHEQPIMVAYVTLDTERLHQYLRESMTDKVDASTYQGITVYQDRQEAHGLAFAVPSEQMIVAASDASAVHAMLDRLEQSSGALSQDAGMMDLIALAASGSDAWFVARDVDAPASHNNGAHDHPMQQDMSDIGTAIRDVAVAFTAGQDGLEGTAYLRTKDGVSSQDVADLTKGLVAAMKAQPDIDARTLRMLDQVRVRSQDNQVRVQFTVDNAMLTSAR